MLIDGFTVAAQVINFLVLIWLLKRYLYRPVLDAIDVRQKHIAKQLQSAEEQQSAASAERLDYEQKQARLSAERDELIKSATQQAEQERLRLLTATREEAKNLRLSFEKRRTEEYRAWQNSLVAKTQTEVVEIVRRVLADLADANLEERIVAVAIRRLGDLDASQRSLLANSASKGTGVVAIKTGFPLSSSGRDSLTTAIRTIVGPTSAVRFTTDCTLICGLEVDLDGRRIAWNVSDYLHEFKLALDHTVTQMPVTAA